MLLIYSFPNSLNLIILTSVKCLSLALVACTIIKMHNIFRLADNHTECLTTAQLRVFLPAQGNLAFLSLLWTSWRGNWKITTPQSILRLCQATPDITTLFYSRWPPRCTSRRGCRNCLNWAKVAKLGANSSLNGYFWYYLSLHLAGILKQGCREC